MKLKNNLYKILAGDKETGTYIIELLPDCVIYKAHFPGFPITPGVCVIQMGAELVSEYSGKQLNVVEVVNAKFLSPINPENVSRLSYSIKKFSEQDGTFKAIVNVTGEDIIYSKLSLIFDEI